MKEYVRMEEEIAADEFQAYYQEVIEKLQKDFAELAEADLLRAKLITSIMAGNANTRQRRKDDNAKKFKKILTKSNFWADAIDYKLQKSGLSEEEIKAKTEEMEATMHLAAEA